MKKRLLILTLCFSPFLFAQNQAKIDSLNNALAKAKNNVEKADLLMSLFKAYGHYDWEKAISYKNKLFELAKRTNDDYVYCSAYSLEGFYFTEATNNPEKDLQNIRKALVYAKRNNFENKLVLLYAYLGEYFTYSPYKKDSALYYLDKSIDVAKEMGDNLYYGNNLYSKGSYYYSEKKHPEALKYFIECDSILSEYSPKQAPILSFVNIGISSIYLDFEDYKKAEKYAIRSIEIANESGNKGGIMAAETTLGKIDIHNKEYIKAEERFNKILEYYVSIGDKFWEAHTLTYLGIAYKGQNRVKEAENKFLEALEINQTLQDSSNSLLTLKNLANLYSDQQEYQKSQEYYLKALNMARKVSNLELETEHVKNLAETNYLLKNYKSAADYYKEYIPLKDSLDASMNLAKTSELETQYQTAKKEQQIELLSAENQLDKQKRKNQFTIFASLIGLLIIIGLTLAFVYRNKLKTAAKIKELNLMKSRFFANISHEFRTPLTLIKSPLQNLQTQLSDENQQKQLSLIDKNSDRMLELVNQLLELSKIDSGKLKLIIKEGNLLSFLKSISEPFAYRANENKLKFSSNLEIPDGKFSYDKDVIEKIVTNLLSNAVKYTPENNKVNFSSNIKNETLTITVSNSGTNLKSKNIPKLFERFHQSDEQNEGFGIGLALIKELVDLYKGKIETTVKDGILSFLVSLPLTQNESENIVIQKNTDKIEEIPQNEPEINGERLVLLIVDDNTEIRNVVKELFSENYTILEAEDGASALKLAQKEIPDCIISDVMMPKMDGFEFTKAIKENELTSFIPVILLTAKTSDEARLEALQNEADAFLTKPFHNEILKESVHQLIAERKKLQQRYSRELILKPIDIAINSVDEKFLEKLSVIMEKELQNPGFSTDDFASELGMSRMQLHRKLKSLLNVSTTEFIRNERLKAAAELMKKGNKNISEIAYTVGFNDVSYFSKSFKDLYNVTPSEYISSI